MRNRPAQTTCARNLTDTESEPAPGWEGNRVQLGDVRGGVGERPPRRESATRQLFAVRRAAITLRKTRLSQQPLAMPRDAHTLSNGWTR
jgi:hypothetical protein